MGPFEVRAAIASVLPSTNGSTITVESVLLAHPSAVESTNGSITKVESALLAHPSVVESAVVGAPCGERGSLVKVRSLSHSLFPAMSK